MADRPATHPDQSPPCAYCGGRTEVSTFGVGYYGRCTACGLSMRVKPTREEALAELQRRPPTPAP